MLSLPLSHLIFSSLPLPPSFISRFFVFSYLLSFLSFFISPFILCSCQISLVFSSITLLSFPIYSPVKPVHFLSFHFSFLLFTHSFSPLTSFPLSVFSFPLLPFASTRFPLPIPFFFLTSLLFSSHSFPTFATSLFDSLSFLCVFPSHFPFSLLIYLSLLLYSLFVLVTPFFLLQHVCRVIQLSINSSWANHVMKWAVWAMADPHQRHVWMLLTLFSFWVTGCSSDCSTFNWRTPSTLTLGGGVALVGGSLAGLLKRLLWICYVPLMTGLSEAWQTSAASGLPHYCYPIRIN